MIAAIIPFIVHRLNWIGNPSFKSLSGLSIIPLILKTISKSTIKAQPLIQNPAYLRLYWSGTGSVYSRDSSVNSSVFSSLYVINCPPIQNISTLPVVNQSFEVSSSILLIRNQIEIADPLSFQITHPIQMRRHIQQWSLRSNYDLFPS